MPYNNSGYGYRQQAGMGLGQGVRTGGMNDQYYSRNGNPGGAYNQQSNQGRYRPPTIQTPGQNTQWNDNGGYSYNIPNSNGSAGNYFDSNQQNRDQYGRGGNYVDPRQRAGYEGTGLSIQPVGGPGGTRGDWGYGYLGGGGYSGGSNGPQRQWNTGDNGADYFNSGGGFRPGQGGNDQLVTTGDEHLNRNPDGSYGFEYNPQPAPRPVYQRGNGSLRAALDQGRMMEQLRYGGYSDSAGGYGQMQQPPRPEYGGMNQEMGRLQEYFGGIGEQSRPAYLRGYFGNNGPRPPAYGGPANDMAVQAPTPLDGGGEPYTGARPISKPTPLDYDPTEARPIAKPQPYGGPASTPPATRPPIPYGGEGSGRFTGAGQSFNPGMSAYGPRPRYGDGIRVQRV